MIGENEICREDSFDFFCGIIDTEYDFACEKIRFRAMRRQYDKLVHRYARAKIAEEIKENETYYSLNRLNPFRLRRRHANYESQRIIRRHMKNDGQRGRQCGYDEWNIESSLHTTWRDSEGMEQERRYWENYYPKYSETEYSELEIPEIEYSELEYSEIKHFEMKYIEMENSGMEYSEIEDNIFWSIAAMYGQSKDCRDNTCYRGSRGRKKIIW